MKSLQIFLAAFLVISAAVYSGCSESTPSGPVPGMGNSTVTKYVAIGNSLTAGYQSNALFASAQNYSFPKLIAQQIQLAGTSLGSFEQPWYSDPGTPGPDGKTAARYEIISMVGPVIGPAGLPAGSPTNSALARPYDNLGIPGAVVFDFLDTTSFVAKAGPPRNNPLFLLVLRSSYYGRSILAQARALKPNLVTFWLGNNDVLGFATSGGVSPSSPTNAAIFSALYAQALDSLRASLPNAMILVGNIPDVRTIAFFTTVGPQIAGKLPAGVTLRYQKHGNASVAFDSTNFKESNPPLICLTGSSYAKLLGAPTGQWYRDNKYPALPPGIDTTKPFGFHPQNPWPDALVLDADEQATAGNAVSAFNATIASVASAKNAVLVDINKLLSDIKANGYNVSGQKYTADYISGGVFSLDGVHPSSRGSGIVANAFIRAMNVSFGMSIPLVDVSAIPGIPAPLSKAGEKVYPTIPYEAFSDLGWLFGSGN